MVTPHTLPEHDLWEAYGYQATAIINRNFRLTYDGISHGGVAGVVFFAVRALLALIPVLTVSFPIKTYKQRRLAARERGESFVTFKVAEQRLRKALLPLLAGGKPVLGASLFAEVFGWSLNY